MGHEEISLPREVSRVIRPCYHPKTSTDPIGTLWILEGVNMLAQVSDSDAPREIGLLPHGRSKEEYV